MVVFILVIELLQSYKKGVWEWSVSVSFVYTTSGWDVDWWKVGLWDLFKVPKLNKHVRFCHGMFIRVGAWASWEKSAMVSKYKWVV